MCTQFPMSCITYHVVIHRLTHTIHSCMSTAVVAWPMLNSRGWGCYRWAQKMYMHTTTYICRILNRGWQPAIVASLPLSHHIDGSYFHDVLTPHPLHTHHLQDNDLPTFPVDPSYLTPLRDRVRLARQVVSMEQRGRRMCRGNKWALPWRLKWKKTCILL